MILSHAPSFKKAISEKNPPQIFKLLKCQVIILHAPNLIKEGWCGVMLCHTAKIPFGIVKFLQKLDKRTGKVIEEYPRTLRIGDAAMVLIKPYHIFGYEKKQKRKNRYGKYPDMEMKAMEKHKGYCVDTFLNCPPLGRFAVDKNRECAMVGIIKEVNPPEPK